MDITGSQATAHTLEPRLAPRLVVGALAVCVLVWGGWWGFKHVLWWTPTGREIASVVRGAAGARWTVLTPPQAYRNVRITPAQMAVDAATAQRHLGDYYTGGALAGWRTVARLNLDPTHLHWGKTSDWMQWWRVDWVHLGELTLFPGSATATATASVEVRSRSGDISRMDYTAHLAHTGAGWRVDREEMPFQPGFGP